MSAFYAGFLCSYQGTNYKLDILTEKSANLLHLMPPKQKADVSKQVRSPMPGLVKSVCCKIGDLVSEGQELCVIGKKARKSKTNWFISGVVFCRGDENAEFHVVGDKW